MLTVPWPSIAGKPSFLLLGILARQPVTMATPSAAIPQKQENTSSKKST